MSKFHNKTRQSQSITQKLLKEERFYLLPVYYLLLTSELAREGIENSGSYRFADHIYENKPKGRFGIGKFIDAVLLNLKSAQSLRARFIHAKEEIHQLIRNINHSDYIDILAVPCGLARELFEVAHELKASAHPVYERVRWHGIDLDDALISMLIGKNNEHRHPMHFWRGDAFDQKTYKKRRNYDMIISTGFIEFLQDDETVRFYKVTYDKLKRNGVFYTSGMTPHKLSEYLMRNIAELHAQYRSEDMLRSMAQQAGFKNIRTYKNQLQTMLVGTKD